MPSYMTDLALDAPLSSALSQRDEAKVKLTIESTTIRNSDERPMAFHYKILLKGDSDET